MKNESDVKEWIHFADMDVLSTNYLNKFVKTELEKLTPYPTLP